MMRPLKAFGTWLAALAMSLSVRAAPPVTFAHDIAPIVYEHCAPCHRPGEAGPFPLLTFEDVKKRATQIADVTRRRYMPPWPPEAGHGDFSGELRLTDTQIGLIADWVSQGSPVGDPSAIPPPPHFTVGWQLGPPDLIVEADQAYALASSGPDVFWNFILKPQVKISRFIRAIEIRPGDKRVVHHANLYVDRARSARAQEKSAGAGFSGMDPIIERTAFDPDDGHFLFWKPGTTPRIEPDGFAWRLDPGNDLVLNAHLQTTGKPEQIRPSVGLYFTDRPQTRFPLLVQLEHDGALNIPAGARDFLVSDDFRLPLDADVLAVYPHAHYLGHLLEGYATLPSGERKWLIRIPDWDPAWQGVYSYRTPLFLPKGTVISMRYHYDNSAANPRNPNQPPRRVNAGNQATDEMGHLWLQVLPKTAPGRLNGDRRMELEEAVLRHYLEKYPDDFMGHFKLGTLRLARLDPPGALAMLQTAVRLEPDHPEARNMLGASLAALGRTAEAIPQFRLALKGRPDYQNARYNLARALVKTGMYDEAFENFRQILIALPQDTDVRNELGELYLSRERFSEAIEQFDRTITIDPKNETARKDRDLALQAKSAHESQAVQ